jgi:protein tyrosine/serine phosphatase
LAAGLMAVLAIFVAGAAVKWNWLDRPLSQPLRTATRTVGLVREAYNFAEVVPGKLYRSGKPDPWLVDYLVRRHGLRRIIALNGSFEPYESRAREWGVELCAFPWNGRREPNDAEVEEVLRAIDRPGAVLVHCNQGANRTGFLIFRYRMLRQHWPPQLASLEAQSFR